MARNFATNAHLPATQDERIRRSSPSRTAQITLNKLGRVFAKPPLVLGESGQDYDALFLRISDTVGPTDDIEVIWLKDIVDLTWDAQRLKRLKDGLLMQAGKQALANLLNTAHDAGIVAGVRVFTVPDLVEAYAAGDDGAIAEVDRALASCGTDVPTVMAQVLVEKLDQISRLEGMIAGAELRRNRLLLEIEARRDAFARRLRLAGYAAPLR